MMSCVNWGWGCWSSSNTKRLLPEEEEEGCWRGTEQMSLKIPSSSGSLRYAATVHAFANLFLKGLHSG